MNRQEAISIFVGDTACSISDIPMCCPDELPCGHNLEHGVRLFLEEQNFHFCIICSKDYSQEQVKANEAMRKNIEEFRDQHCKQDCTFRNGKTQKLRSYQAYSITIKTLIEKWKITASKNLEEARLEREQQTKHEIEQMQKDVVDIIYLHKVMEMQIVPSNNFFKELSKVVFSLNFLILVTALVAYQIFF